MAGAILGKIGNTLINIENGTSNKINGTYLGGDACTIRREFKNWKLMEEPGHSL